MISLKFKMEESSNLSSSLQAISSMLSILRSF